MWCGGTINNLFNYFAPIVVIFSQISEDLEEASQKSALHAEESMILSGELANEKELSRAEIDGLHEQCEKVLRQNSSLLKNMASMENDLEKGQLALMSILKPSTTLLDSILAVVHIPPSLPTPTLLLLICLSPTALHDLTSSGVVMTSKIAVDTAHANAIAAMECKLFRISEKLKISEEKCIDLTAENGQINVLKSTLRDRNNSIKDLNRILEDREKNKQPSSESFDDLREKIVELMRENKTLKQALTVATVGPRQNLVERTGK